MALACGADFVFELPALFAVRDAAHFAQGGVGLLDALGADWLGFGSEDRGACAALDRSTDGTGCR